MTKQYSLPLKIQNITIQHLYKNEKPEFCYSTCKRKPVLIFQQLTEEGSSLVLLSFSLVLRARLSVPSCLQAQLKKTDRVLKVVKGCVQCWYMTGSKQHLLFEILAAVLFGGQWWSEQELMRFHCPFSLINDIFCFTAVSVALLLRSNRSS